MFRALKSNFNKWRLIAAILFLAAPMANAISCDGELPKDRPLIVFAGPEMNFTGAFRDQIVEAFAPGFVAEDHVRALRACLMNFRSQRVRPGKIVYFVSTARTVPATFYHAEKSRWDFLKVLSDEGGDEQRRFVLRPTMARVLEMKNIMQKSGLEFQVLVDGSEPKVDKKDYPFPANWFAKSQALPADSISFALMNQEVKFTAMHAIGGILGDEGRAKITDRIEFNPADAKLVGQLLAIEFK